MTLTNGIDAREYIEKFSYQEAPLQDPDASSNLMFYEKAFALQNIGRGLGSFSGGGRFRYIYPGASTIFEFEMELLLYIETSLLPKATSPE